MRRLFPIALLITLACSVPARARLDVQHLDVQKLAQAHKQWDQSQNGGRGRSFATDSGKLGWKESAFLRRYARMWQVTHDPYWLGQIRDHFKRIMANATDPDGDGYRSWQSKSFSTAVAWARPLHNVSKAAIKPDQQNAWHKTKPVTGHTYLIEFPQNAKTLRLRDADTQHILADGLTYKDGMHLRQIKPFDFTLTGTPHQGDRFMVRTVAPQALEFAVHQGMILYPVAIFIEAVKHTPSLQKRFGDDADRFLAFINKNVFEKNEQAWLDMGDGTGAYQFQPKITDRHPNRILPYNEALALTRVWLVLKDVKGANPKMGQRARQMAKWFKQGLTLDKKHNAYVWNYWDWVENAQRAHGRMEDTSHGHIDVGFAAEAARRGVVFDDQDMQRFANTFLKVMWNGDEQIPKVSGEINGDEPADHSAFYIGWAKLAQWSPKVYQLELKAFRQKNKMLQARNAPIMLLCAKRAGKLNPQNQSAQPQPRAGRPAP